MNIWNVWFLLFIFLACGEDQNKTLKVYDGVDGKNGLNGKPGMRGERGEAGVDGRAGPQGVQGPMGPQGVQGTVGPQGVSPEKRQMWICSCLTPYQEIVSGDFTWRWESKLITVETFVIHYLHQSIYLRGKCR